MDHSIAKNKDFSLDGLFWFFWLVFLFMTAFLLMSRDASKHYGAVAYGVFPAFAAVGSDGKDFDQHKLHGWLSAVIVSDQNLSEDTARYLSKLSQTTAHGKKYLRVLVLVDHAQPISSRSVEYLVLDAEEFKRIARWKSVGFKDGIMLVDQNAIIRGVFDLNEKLERLNFESAVRGIL